MQVTKLDESDLSVGNQWGSSESRATDGQESAVIDRRYSANKPVMWERPQCRDKFAVVRYQDVKAKTPLR